MKWSSCENGHRRLTSLPCAASPSCSDGGVKSLELQRSMEHVSQTKGINDTANGKHVILKSTDVQVVLSKLTNGYQILGPVSPSRTGGFLVYNSFILAEVIVLL